MIRLLHSLKCSEIKLRKGTSIRQINTIFAYNIGLHYQYFLYFHFPVRNSNNKNIHSCEKH
jgi:hypothetical protein